MRRLGLLLATALAMAPLSPAGATAGTGGVVTLAGTGVIGPGLTVTPTNQAVAFTGTIGGTVTAGGNTYTFTGLTCAFNGGSSQPETTATGRGKVHGGCTGTGTVTIPPRAPLTATLTVFCDVNYARAAKVVNLTAKCTIRATVNGVGMGGTNPFNARGLFDFTPTSFPVTTSFALSGTASIPDMAPCLADKTFPCKKA